MPFRLERVKMSPTTNEMYNIIKPKPKLKKRIIILSAAAVITALIVILIIKVAAAEKTIVYSTVKPYIGTIKSTVSANGTISATNEVKIGSQISGTISNVLVEENDEVKKGQTMAIINPETINQTIDRNKAQLNSAKAALAASHITMKNKKWNYNMLEELNIRTGGKSPSKQELQNAKTEYETAVADIAIKKAAIIEAETNLKSAEIDLKNSIIVSPIDGVVLLKSIEAGQTVAASFSTPELFTVAENLEKMKLVVNVSEAEVGKVKEGQNVEFSVDTYPDNIFYSTVYRVNMGATDSNDNIVSYETTIYVDNKNLLLRSGMSATADIETASAKNALIVPVSALFFDPGDVSASKPAANKGGGMFGPPRRKREVIEEKKISSSGGAVWALKNGKPERIPVEIGVSDGKNTQITSDLIDTDSEIIIGVQTKK